MWIRSFDKFERVGESLSTIITNGLNESVYLIHSQLRLHTNDLQYFFSKIMSGMEHRLTDSNLIISRSDLNALKNVLVDKIHEKSTLIYSTINDGEYKLWP